MRKGVLLFAITAALTVTALDQPSAMPTMATGALKVAASANARVERAGYYLWGNYYEPDARPNYYVPYGGNGLYRPSHGYFSSYQTYGCTSRSGPILHFQPLAAVLFSPAFGSRAGSLARRRFLLLFCLIVIGGGTDEIFQRALIDLVALMDIDRAPHVAFEAGVEEA